MNRYPLWCKGVTIASAALLFFYSFLLIATSLWIEDKFGPTQADAILFTVTTPHDGFNLSHYLGYIKRPIGVLFFTCLYVFLLLKTWPNAARRQTYAAKKGAFFFFLSQHLKSIFITLFLVSILAFIASNVFVEKKHALFSTLFRANTTTTLYEEHYRYVNWDEVAFPEKKRNVIFIILESVEETFNSDHFEKPLMPELKNLRGNNPSFYGYKLTNGASWTAGGVTAYLFGIPLMDFIGCNMSLMEHYLPAAASLPGIFEKNGYDIAFFLGTSKKFAGQDKIFTTHTRHARIYGRRYFQEHTQFSSEVIEYNGWHAVPDNIVFEEAKKQLAQSDRKKPFFWIIQTMDTHVPGRFNGLIQKNYNGDMRDCLRESSMLVGNFVEWVRKQRFGPDTTIILIGDHPMMTNQVGPVALPDRKYREVYNVFINPAIPVEKTCHHRTFAAFDFAPTIIESTGAKLLDGRFGLGTSLFRTTQKNLFEQRGEEYYQGESMKNSDVYRTFFKKRADSLKQ